MKVFSENINGVDIVAQINGVDVEGSDWSLTTKFMAEDRMTLTASIPVNQESDTKIKFGKDWYVKDEYGNIYTLVSAQPTSSKKSKSLETSYSLVFGGADIFLSKRTYREKATLGDRQLSYSSTVAFIGNIDDFLERLDMNLEAAFGKTILVGIDYECKYKIVRSYGDISFSQSDYKSVSFSNLSIWEVLLKTNEIYGYEWLSYTDTTTGQIVFEFNTTVGETLGHEFTYRGDRNYDLSTEDSLNGIQGGITDLTITDKMSEVKTRITGTGGTTNIPLNHYILSDYNYLRDYEVAERPTYLRNLMPRVYRCYVMGFNDQRYYLAKDPNSDDVINDNEAYPKVMDLENRFSYHDAADDIASGDITIDTFEAWHLNYKNVWNKPTATDAAQYSRLNLDDDWYALDDKNTPDWDDLTTPPYGFKAYLKGWNDRAKAFEVIDEDSKVVPEAFFDPISYVDSIHQADYGIIEKVNEADESIYPALGDDVNDIIDAEVVEPDGKAAVVPYGVFPMSESSDQSRSNFKPGGQIVVEDFGESEVVEYLNETGLMKSKTLVTRKERWPLTDIYWYYEYKYEYRHHQIYTLSHTSVILSTENMDGNIKLSDKSQLTAICSGVTKGVDVTIEASLYSTKGDESTLVASENVTYTSDSVVDDQTIYGTILNGILLDTIPDSHYVKFDITGTYNMPVIREYQYKVEYRGYNTSDLEFKESVLLGSVDIIKKMPSSKFGFSIIVDTLDASAEDKQTFDIWIKDIDFNIAEINKNEYSLTIQFDSYYNLYKEVVDGETDPPDGFTEEEYLSQILSYLELLSTYFSDIGLTYGWEQIKYGFEGRAQVGNEGDDDYAEAVTAFIVRPAEYESDEEYSEHINKMIGKVDPDKVASGNSGTGNLYKYFGTQNPVIKFTTGDIAGEYEYELAVIGGQPQVFEDTSKYVELEEGNPDSRVYSKYRLTLMRNSDDYDATGLLLPGGTRQAKAGNRFELSKIELPFSWLYDGENRQEEYMRSQLAEIDTHQPDVAIELDDIFLTDVLGDSRHKDYGKFKAGATIKVKSPLIDVYDANGVKSDEYEVRINSYTKTSKETKVSK